MAYIFHYTYYLLASTTTISFLLRFIGRLNHGHLERNVCLNINICKYLIFNFHPLEVVGRASETQLQVGENWNDLISGIMVKLLYHQILFVQFSSLNPFLGSKTSLSGTPFPDMKLYVT